MVISAAMMLKQRAIVRRFERAAATTVATACTPEQLGLKAGIVWFGLVHHGVLRCPGEGRYYLDRNSWLRLGKLRRRVASGIGIAVALLMVLYFSLRQS